jgi:hypothetical protein
LKIANTHVTDAGLAHLKGLTGLKRLLLGDAPITDKGLEHLRGLTNLETLGLNSPHITDAGLKHLSNLPMAPAARRLVLLEFTGMLVPPFQQTRGHQVFNFVRISGGAALRLHAMARLAAAPEARYTNGKMAEMLGASHHHLAKVMPKLVKAGLVRVTARAAGSS